MGPTRRSKPTSSSSRLRRLRREHLRPLPRLRSSWLPRSLWPRQRRSRGRRGCGARLRLCATGHLDRGRRLCAQRCGRRRGARQFARPHLLGATPPVLDLQEGVPMPHASTCDGVAWSPPQLTVTGICDSCCHG
jgi:hypothetical protein